MLERPLGCADYRSDSPLFKLVWGRDFRAANAEARVFEKGAQRVDRRDVFGDRRHPPRLTNRVPSAAPCIAANTNWGCVNR